ncbi:MAG: sensor histidine kinase [Bradymonadia bacterium]
MRVQPRRNISITIIVGVISIGLTIAILVGWTLVVVRNAHLAQQVTQDGSSNVWLLVAGILSLVTIMISLIMLSVFLVREIMRGSRQTRFIDSVTHELKSPLASLKLCLQTFGRSGLTDDQRGQLSDMMKRDVDRLATFIDDVLAAGRLTHGKVVLVWSRIELREVLQRLAQQAFAQHQVEDGVLELDVPADLVMYADPTVMEMILKNLIDNAVKYSDPPVRLHVTGRVTAKKRIALEITDEGIGIPKGQLKHIFKRFYRVDRDDVRARHGTGLGLFVVRALVKSLGGKLSAHSEGAGKGTSMRIMLPIGRHRETTEVPALQDLTDT